MSLGEFGASWVVTRNSDWTTLPIMIDSLRSIPYNTTYTAPAACAQTRRHDPRPRPSSCQSTARPSARAAWPACLAQAQARIAALQARGEHSSRRLVRFTSRRAVLQVGGRRLLADRRRRVEWAAHTAAAVYMVYHQSTCTTTAANRLPSRRDPGRNPAQHLAGGR